MKVICVKQFEGACRLTGIPMKSPEVGDENEVTEAVTNNYGSFYTLAGYPNNHMYGIAHFATLPPEEPAVVNEQEFEAIIYQK